MQWAVTAGVWVSIHHSTGDRMRDRGFLHAAVAGVLLPDAAIPVIGQRCVDCGGDHGQPLIGDGDAVWASLTRAGGVVAVAVSTAGPVGIDLADPAAVTRAPLDAFGADEVTLIRDSADPARTTTRLWTAKEAILKADGRGLRCDPRDLRLGIEPFALMRWDDCPVPLDAVTVDRFDEPRGLLGTVASFAVFGPAQVRRGRVFE
ncbi:4'-phosphopantetheinyl transferase family protein [Lacisediminihabitans sp. FW035]